MKLPDLRLREKKHAPGALLPPSLSLSRPYGNFQFPGLYHSCLYYINNNVHNWVSGANTMANYTIDCVSCESAFRCLFPFFELIGNSPLWFPALFLGIITL